MKIFNQKSVTLLAVLSFLITIAAAPTLAWAEDDPAENTVTTDSKGSATTSVGAFVKGDTNKVIGISKQEVSKTTDNSPQEISKTTGNSVHEVSGSTESITSIGSYVSGNNNTAIGTSTQRISSTTSSAPHPDAQVKENKSQGTTISITSIGAYAGNGDNNYAIGNSIQNINGSNTTTSPENVGAIAGFGNGNTAVGNKTLAGTSNYNTAIGYGAIATTGNSVAIGAFSIADRPNSVSVGQPGYERQITNVAPGVYDTDAVNMSQLRNTDSKIDRVGASAFAMSALAPLPYNPNEPTQYSAGIGTYNGKYAFAVGIFHYTKENVMLNAAIAFSNDGWERSARAGITWRVGKKTKPVELPKPLIINNTTPEVKQEAKQTPPVQDNNQADDNAAKIRND
jgi:hypothetical protein